MIPFDALDYPAQTERLHNAALHVLDQWRIQPIHVTLMSYLNNAVFHIVAHGGEYALRLSRPSAGRAAWLDGEVLWLEHLHQAGLPVPQPQRLPNGEPYTQVPVAAAPAPFFAALLWWQKGHFASLETLTATQAEQAGHLLGQLHQCAATFHPPAGFTRPRLDWEGLFGEDSPYNPGPNASIYTPEQRRIFDATAAHIRSVMAQPTSDAQAFGIIHADFVLKNILFQREGAAAIDFDDCAWGHYLYDLAPLLLQLVDAPHYVTLRGAFLRGYAAIRPLPLDDITLLESFIAARQLASCRWLARNLHNPRIRARTPELLAGRAAQLQRFLETGRIDQRGEEF